jgi:integrase
VYWTLLSPACSLGYRRGPGSKCGTWIAKYSPQDGKRVQSRLAASDDVVLADGLLSLDFEQARRRALEWFPVAVQLSSGQIPRRKGYRVADACSDYLNLLQGRSKSFEVTRYMVNANILPALGEKLVEKLTRSHVSNWHNGLASTARRKPRRGLDPHCAEAQRQRRDTANRNLVVLKAALNHCLCDGKIACSDLAWKMVSAFKGVGNARTRFLSDEEASALVTVCHDDFRRLVQAALFSGARYSEIVALRVQDFDIISGTLLIAQSKSGKSRRIYLDVEANLFFRSVCIQRSQNEPMFLRSSGEPWKKDAAQVPIETATKLAGIPNTTFHELRHTAASRWARVGLTLQEIAAQLGHADIRMTQRYAHLCQHTLAAKIQSLPPMNITIRETVSLAANQRLQ